MAKLVPYALKDAPALIEKVFPAQKVSFEAQRERKANLGQTLTSLGSYWKGRKPLILVRAILLGSLLPQSVDAEQDLQLFEALLAFDLQGLGRRAVDQATFKPDDIARLIELKMPWEYFSFTFLKGSKLSTDVVLHWSFPVDIEALGVRINWRRGISNEAKAGIYAKALATLPTYEERSLLCKRPEEVDQDFLYAPIWSIVNNHLSYLGINAHSIQELVEQLGTLRYGHRPRVGDTFAGGGSIPFEAARIGCDVHASDLNPVACMLNWGNINIIGSSPEKHAKIEEAQRSVANLVESKINELGIEHDRRGNRAKAYLYCLETRCPETGWMVPLAPSWVISKGRNILAKLIPNHALKRFEIEIMTNCTTQEMKSAEIGTVVDGKMVYILDGKTYSTPIKTLRGDYRAEDGATANRLRHWKKSDFKPHPDDIFQERLYCIQWITKETLDQSRQTTFFAQVNQDDIEREHKVEAIVEKNLAEWQEKGLVPDMAIESGDKTDELIRTRGWTYWHHLFNARHLLLNSVVRSQFNNDNRAYFNILFCRILNVQSKLSIWSPAIGHDLAVAVFYNMALNTFFNYGCRASISAFRDLYGPAIANNLNLAINWKIKNQDARLLNEKNDIYITDPPYVDAVFYHEITEFFIAWLRKDPPIPFNEWTWDSRRALAIKGDGDDFRSGMIDSYKAMTTHMPDNGMQCVMFTHQDAGVWSDMVGIFWAAGLQVVAAWYIATETTFGLKKGGYVQGTVTLMLRKRPSGENVGFKQHILPAVRREVHLQIEQMMHLNKEIKDKMGEPIFNDSDLQMAGYAAALKVLTGYTSIGGEDVTAFALRPRRAGETSIVDEIIQQASEAANSILIPDGLSLDAWRVIDGVQRFYMRMIDMETTGVSKLDNYQNFAKAFRVTDYTKVMANMSANAARLKSVTDFTSRDLTDSTEIGPTSLGRLIIALQQLIGETEPQAVIRQLQEDLADFMELRPVLIDLVEFLAQKSNQILVREAAEILSSRLHNQRVLGQN